MTATPSPTPPDTTDNQAPADRPEARPRTLRQRMTRLLIEQLNALQGDADATLEEDLSATVETMFRDASREGASDIHIDPHGEAVALRFRVDGRLHDVAMIDPAQARRLSNQLKTMASLDPVTVFTPHESRWTYSLPDRELDLRLACTPCLGGEKITLRLLDPSTAGHQLDDLGLPEEHLDRVASWVERPGGMVLAAGPTGNGKTTTLYALLHRFARHERSVMTLEDPVEYLIEGITQIQVDEKHDLTFAKGVRAMLRLDPDYLMIGEVRDGASARSAIEAAITGKIVMSTLHSRDAVATITALRNFGVANHQIAASLSLVIAQRLVRKLCPHCREQGPLTDEQRRWLQSLDQPLPQITWHARGCDRCHQLGYHGRTGLFELWELDEDDYTDILSDQDERAIRRRLARAGHPTLFRDALAKVDAGVTSFEEIRLLTASGPITPRLERVD